MQDIMDTIIRNRNLLHKQYKEVENELDYLYLEGDEDAILEELDLLAGELIKTSFVNCTPHFITIEGIGELPPSGILPRVEALYGVSSPLNGVRVGKALKGSVTGLPDPVEGLSFIVSILVVDTLRGHRNDCYAPDTGSDAIRNEKGHIVAVRGLVQ